MRKKHSQKISSTTFTADAAAYPSFYIFEPVAVQSLYSKLWSAHLFQAGKLVLTGSM